MTAAGQAVGSETDDSGAGLTTSADLRAELKRAKDKPASCALGLTRDGQAVILIGRLLKPRKLLSQMKAKAKTTGLDLNLTSLRFGWVSTTEGGPVAITLNKEVPPAIGQKFKPVMRAAGHPNFTINADPSIENEPYDDETEHASSTAQQTTRQTAAATATAPGITPPPARPSGVVSPELADSIRAAVVVDPSRKPALTRLLAQVRAAIESGDPHAAAEGIAALRQATQAPTPPPSRAESSAPAPANDPRQTAPPSSAPPNPQPALQPNANLARLSQQWKEYTKATQETAARQANPEPFITPAFQQGASPISSPDGKDLFTPARFQTPLPEPSSGPASPPPGLRAPSPVPTIGRFPQAPPPDLPLPATRIIGGVAIVVVAGALANELNNENFANQTVKALQDFALDPMKPADVKAAQAYVFMRILAPASLQFWSVPAQDPGNGRAAEAVLRAVQADPDLLDHALQHDKSAADKLEDIIQRALGNAAQPATPATPASPGYDPSRPSALREPPTSRPDEPMAQTEPPTSTIPAAGAGGNTGKLPPGPPENVRQDGECDEDSNMGPTSTRPNLPTSDGTWLDHNGSRGTPGNSLWFSNKATVQAVTGGKGISFVNGRPDFTPWAKLSINLPYGDLVGVNRFDYAKTYEAISRADPDRFPTAREAKRWADKRSLTPHHALDTCMQLVPTPLNNLVPHVGSASDLRKNPPVADK